MRKGKWEWNEKKRRNVKDAGRLKGVEKERAYKRKERMGGEGGEFVQKKKSRRSIEEPKKNEGKRGGKGR